MVSILHISFNEYHNHQGLKSFNGTLISKRKDLIKRTKDAKILLYAPRLLTCICVYLFSYLKELIKQFSNLNSKNGNGLSLFSYFFVFCCCDFKKVTEK